jgi:hypothetical protein
MTRTIVRTVTVALVLGALAAPAASARPADAPPAAAKARAAEQHKQARRPANATDAAAAAAEHQPARRPANTNGGASRQRHAGIGAPTPTAADSGVAWMIGIGIAGGLLGAGTVAVVAGRRHGRSRTRVSA